MAHLVMLVVYILREREAKILSIVIYNSVEYCLQNVQISIKVWAFCFPAGHRDYVLAFCFVHPTCTNFGPPHAYSIIFSWWVFLIAVNKLSVCCDMLLECVFQEITEIIYKTVT